VFVEIHAIQLGFPRQPQEPSCVDRKHDDHGHAKGGRGDAGAANGLGKEHLCAATIEQALEWGAIVGTYRAGWRKLTAANRPSDNVPKCRRARHRPRAIGSVDAEPLEQGPTPIMTSTPATRRATRRRWEKTPITRAGDGHESGEEAIGRESQRPTSWS